MAMARKPPQSVPPCWLTHSTKSATNRPKRTEHVHDRLKTRLTYNCAHLRSTKESLTVELVRKIFADGNISFLRRRRKKKKIFGEGKHIYFAENKNGEGKGGKYVEKENVTIAGRRTKKERSYSANGPWKEG